MVIQHINEQLKDIILNFIKESPKPVTFEDIKNITAVPNNEVVSIIRKLIDNKRIFKIVDKKGKKHFCTTDRISEFKGYHIAPETNFQYIKKIDDLILYLQNRSKSIEKNFVCHYTRLDAAVAIIKSGFWYLGNAEDMNDCLETQHFPDMWSNIFYACFMTEQTESIAMWSMYAQPWEDGVMLRIPIDKFKKWIKEIKKAYCAIDNSKNADLNREINKMDMKVSAQMVAYANYDYVDEQDRALYCGRAKNEYFKDIYSHKSMVGYIKDSAWSYEKEMRLRVDIIGSIKCTGILVKIPDYVIDSIQIMKGPRFIGDLKIKIQEKIERSIILEKSIYYEKLKSIPCDNCKKLKTEE